MIIRKLFPRLLDYAVASGIIPAHLHRPKPPSSNKTIHAHLIESGMTEPEAAQFLMQCGPDYPPAKVHACLLEGWAPHASSSKHRHHGQGLQTSSIISLDTPLYLGE